MQRRIVITSLACMAALTLLMSGCSSLVGADGAKPAGKDVPYRVAISNQAFSINFAKAIGDGMKDEADKLGVHIVSDLDARSDPQKQASDVQDILATKPDGVLFIPVAAAESASMIDSLVTARIPVIAVHGQVGSNQDINYMYHGLSGLLMENEVKAGELAGGLAKKALPDGGKTGVILGQTGYAEVAYRLDGFTKAIAGSGFDIVAKQNADWQPSKGQEVCQSMLSAHPDLRLLYAEDDGMATGCIQAVKAAGSSAVVIGIGGSKAGLSAIKSGDMYGTVCYTPFTEGRIAMQMMYELLSGKSTPSSTPRFYDTPAVTKDNVADCPGEW